MNAEIYAHTQIFIALGNKIVTMNIMEFTLMFFFFDDSLVCKSEPLIREAPPHQPSINPFVCANITCFVLVHFEDVSETSLVTN